MTDEIAQYEDNTEELIRLRNACKRFRVLIIGRANAGKTTICQKMCNTSDPPIVHDEHGNKVWIFLMNEATKLKIHALAIDRSILLPVWTYVESSIQESLT